MGVLNNRCSASALSICYNLDEMIFSGITVLLLSRELVCWRTASFQLRTYWDLPSWPILVLSDYMQVHVSLRQVYFKKNAKASY